MSDKVKTPNEQQKSEFGLKVPRLKDYVDSIIVSGSKKTPKTK